MRTIIAVEVDDLLYIVCCAQDRGCSSVIMGALVGILGRQLSDEEIVVYADGYITPEMIAKGYGKADRDNALESLREFKAKYIDGEKATQ